MAKDRINNAVFRQKLDPITKNILRKENPFELVFEDISTFDAENPIVGSLLKELDVGKKKGVASEVIKNAPRPPGTDFMIRNRLNRLKNRQEFNNDNKNNNNNNNLSLPTSPPSLPLFLLQQPPPQPLPPTISYQQPFLPLLPPTFSPFQPLPSPTFSLFQPPVPPSPTPTFPSFQQNIS